METLKTPSEYSVDFNRGFQGFSMANLEKGVYSFMVFKYVNLILWQEKYILGRIGLYFWGFGEKLNLFKDFGSKGKYFEGAEEFSFRD